jgi:hypothetical protein
VLEEIQQEFGTIFPAENCDSSRRHTPTDSHGGYMRNLRCAAVAALCTELGRARARLKSRSTICRRSGAWARLRIGAVFAAMTSIVTAAFAADSPLVFGRRDPMPELPKYWGYSTCVNALHQIHGDSLVFINERPRMESLAHGRYYRFHAVRGLQGQMVQIYVGCTTSRNGRRILSLVSGPEYEIPPLLGDDSDDESE